MFKKILVPTDGSALSEKSAKAAIQFAAANHASLVIIAIIHPISALSLFDALAFTACPTNTSPKYCNKSRLVQPDEPSWRT